VVFSKKNKQKKKEKRQDIIRLRGAKGEQDEKTGAQVLVGT
jgi:hypothetical protein